MTERKPEDVFTESFHRNTVAAWTGLSRLCERLRFNDIRYKATDTVAFSPEYMRNTEAVTTLIIDVASVAQFAQYQLNLFSSRGGDLSMRNTLYTPYLVTREEVTATVNNLAEQARARFPILRRIVLWYREHTCTDWLAIDNRVTCHTPGPDYRTLTAGEKLLAATEPIPYINTMGPGANLWDVFGSDHEHLSALVAMNALEPGSHVAMYSNNPIDPWLLCEILRPIPAADAPTLHWLSSGFHGSPTYLHINAFHAAVDAMFPSGVRGASPDADTGDGDMDDAAYARILFLVLCDLAPGFGQIYGKGANPSYFLTNLRANFSSSTSVDLIDIAARIAGATFTVPPIIYTADATFEEVQKREKDSIIDQPWCPALRAAYHTQAMVLYSYLTGEKGRRPKFYWAPVPLRYHGTII